ncbi:MAG TPA: class I SAM-dependent methyltransferase [Acidimicrobiales bacterium]|nr:class I SAM-dependent methyltransferase [Acidimicrobiales bacterium]
MSSTWGGAHHWDAHYRARGEEGVSWHQREPTLSLELIELANVGRDAAVLDVGAGTSLLLDRLLAAGYSDVTALDVSEVALAAPKSRIGEDARATFVCEDVLTWTPPRRYGMWHDRAVFHFLTDPTERAAYVERLHAALQPTGSLVVATFATDGPAECSGLEVARYDAAQLAHALQVELVATRSELHVTPDGRTQPFTWILARATQPT